MAKNDQQSSWNSKRFKSSHKNDEKPVPEIDKRNKTQKGK